MSDDARVRTGPGHLGAGNAPPTQDEPTMAQRPERTARRLDNEQVLAGTHDPVGVRTGPDAQLISVRGRHAGTRYRLRGESVRIGRNPDSDIRLNDVTVSREHAQLRRTGAGFTVTDLRSMNGTYVNQERVDRATLRDEDEIQIGRFRLVFRAAAG